MRTTTTIDTPNFWGELKSDTLRLSSLALAIIGAANAGYLAWTKLTNVNIYCGPGSNACDAVSASQYGYVLGIPVSYLGFLTYLVLIALFALETRLGFLKSNGPLIVFGLTLFGTVFTGYLQFASLVWLREVCPYCVVNAVLIFALLVLAVIRLRRQWWMA
jgi:uncharacterized membrane protein